MSAAASTVGVPQRTFFGELRLKAIPNLLKEGPELVPFSVLFFFAEEHV